MSPAKSKAQQALMGMAMAYKRGELKKASKVVKDLANSMSIKDLKDYAETNTKNLPKKVKKEERDYKDEYKKFQSSTKAKKYRAELNKYNREKGTYGNGDGKDASHKSGKIAGFEEQSKNRGRKEKSRLKKKTTENIDMNEQKLRKMIREELLNENKGRGEATKIIDKWRRSLFPKLSEDELWEFGSTMREFFKEYK